MSVKIVREKKAGLFKLLGFSLLSRKKYLNKRGGEIATVI